MLADRNYMRDLPGQRSWSWGVVLMIVLGVCFALQQINAVYFRLPVDHYFELSPEGLRHGLLFQLLTFQFLHAGLGHLLGNLLGIWCFGRFLEETLGRKHFLTVYLVSGTVGGLFQGILGLADPVHFGASTVGASAGVFGLISIFCLLQPHARILLFFVLPVPARFLFYFCGGIALFFTVVPSDPGYAHAAHLGGFLCGIAYLRWIIQSPVSLQNWSPWRVLSRGVRQKPKPIGLRPISNSQKKVIDLPEEFISEEVDPILDKISAQGIQSLTDRERKILEAARARMAKR